MNILLSLRSTFIEYFQHYHEIRLGFFTLKSYQMLTEIYISYCSLLLLTQWQKEWYARKNTKSIPMMRPAANIYFGPSITKMFLVVQLWTMPSWICFHLNASKEKSLQHPCSRSMFHPVCPLSPFHVQFLAPSISADPPFQSGRRISDSLPGSELEIAQFNVSGSPHPLQHGAICPLSLSFRPPLL